MLKSRVKLVLVVSIAAFLVAAGFAEAYLRWKAPAANSTIDEYAPELYTHDGQRISQVRGALRLELAPFTIYKNAPSQSNEAFTINSLGMRGPEPIDADSAPRILLLGASAAFGQGARSDEETISALLERLLPSHRVLNAGVVGFHSGQELAYLVTEMIDHEPKIVIVYDGWNDVFDSLYFFERSERELGFNNNFFILESQLVLNHRSKISAYKSLVRFIDALSNQSLLIDRIVQVIRAYRYGKSGSQQVQTNPYSIVNKSLIGSILDNYVRTIEKMARFSRASGARFVVVFQPELGQKLRRTPEEEDLLNQGIVGIRQYRNEFPALYRDFIEKAKLRLKDKGVQWLDINEDEAFQGSPKRLFVDVVHTNRHGNELVAQAIHRRLEGWPEDQ
jgi:lysophospholipase L1-like esterase